MMTGTKRKREETWPDGLQDNHPRFSFGLSRSEGPQERPVNKIIEDLSNQFAGLKLSQSPSNALRGICSTPMDNLMGRLPEDILSYIISLMSLREAATTSILSKRWRYLWRTSSKLDLHAGNMIGYEKLFHIERRCFEWKQKHKSRFVSWVYHILELHVGKKVDSFRVEYPLGRDHGRDFDQWIQYAINKQVEELEFNITDDCLDAFDELYKFPYWLFTQRGKRSIIKHLSLDGCSLSLPAGFNGFNSLSYLSLVGTRLSQENVDNIFSNCPILERFTMTLCPCPSHLKISGGRPFLKLKHLRIFRCYHLEDVEIHDAMSIAAIDYTVDKFGRVLLKNSAQPVRLCLNWQSNPLASVTYVFGALAKEYPQVETLLLSFCSIKVGMIPKQFSTFTRLKQLVLFGSVSKETLLDMTFAFLEAAPSLVKFEIDLHLAFNEKGDRKIAEAAEYIKHKNISLKEHCRHQHLKEVELHAFCGYPVEFDLAVCLLKNAIALEKMIIDRWTSLYAGHGERSVMDWGEWEKPKIKGELVFEILSSVLPCTTNVVLV